MHILFNSNKFHKFWMSCACRNSLSKDGRNQRRFRLPGTFRADRPDISTYMGPIFIPEQRDTFIRLHNEANISNSVDRPGRHKDQAKDPHASAQNVKWGNHPSQRHCGVLICNIGETEGWEAPEAGHPASPGPLGLKNQHLRKLAEELTFRSDQQRPQKVGGQMAQS